MFIPDERLEQLDKASEEPTKQGEAAAEEAEEVSRYEHRPVGRPRKLTGKTRTVSIVLEESDWLKLQHYNLELQIEGKKPIRCSTLGRELLSEWINEHYNPQHRD